MNTVSSPDLEIAYHAYGQPGDRTPLILLHGFPDDASAWRDVGPRLAAAGHYAVAPYVRGCGPTRFKAADTMRSGQPAARARDLLALMDGLAFDKAVLVGQDWGATTAQATSMLQPDRVDRLVILNGHGLLNMGVFAQGRLPSWATFHAGWYQWLFQSPMAKSLLQADRAGFIGYVWRTWSPGWQFSQADLDGVLHSAENPDWVDIVLSAYRGQDDPAADPQDAAASRVLQDLPGITCPTLNLQGADDAVDLHIDTQLGQQDYYRGRFASKLFQGCGHFLHRERPDAVADAILEFLN